MKRTSSYVLALSIALLASTPVAHAGISIIGTRVIYPASEREVTVQLRNQGEAPRIVQSWIDEGDIRSTAETANAPFLLTPPVARVDPGKGQVLRLAYLGGDVPQDRESVYWLNVLEIPPAPQQSEMSILQFAVRTRIKIFFRPVGLPGSPKDAITNVTWRLLDGGTQAECTNASAYNVSFSDVRLKDAPIDPTIGKGGLCPAKGREVFPLKGGTQAGTLIYRAIDDNGAFMDGEATYTQ